MPKRKREGDLGDDSMDIEDQRLQTKVSTFKATLHRSIKSLHAALRLARGFERQKLGRRQKSASNEPKTLLRLREEVIVLKQLQLEQTAKNYLLKQLSKTKRIKEHAVFVKLYGSGPNLEHPKSSAEGNLLGRLFNSAPVKQVVPDITKTIYSVLEIPLAGSGDTATKGTVKPGINKTKPDSIDEDDADLKEGPDLTDEDEQPFDAYPKALLAFSDQESDDDSFGDEETVRPGDMRPQPEENERLRRRSHSISPSLGSFSGSDEVDQAREKPMKPVNKTAFLPSLSLGGYYSGSESEDSDAHETRGPALPKIRNNRRGQRARQQLAELKFGKNAKHLAKQTERDATGARDAGWDPKRGAIDPGSRRKERFRTGRAGPKTAGRPENDPSRPSKPKPKERDDQGPLHPSWEAAKKRKMQDQTQATFQGKKVTFD